MPARIIALGTAVPPHAVAQRDVRDLFVRQPHVDRLTARLISAAFDAAEIDRRFTVISDLVPADDGGEASGFVAMDGELRMPSTAARNRAYTGFAPGLFAAAAREALDEAEVAASAVTHVVTVSCTGFFAPGPDYRLVRDLGLPTDAERYHLGFLGCAAAIPGLRLAARIAEADPRAVVLVVCAELCSLHIRASADPQQIVAASVFGDGAAAAVVSADPGVGRPGGLALERFATALTAEGETDMVWTIGDEGFEMTLSPEVPRIVGREILGAVDAFLGPGARPDAWAVHPGGRSVLDRVEASLALEGGALDASRRVLREFGNMSSATLLFILRGWMDDAALPDGAAIAAIAFGPGLTVESALLTKLPEGELPDRAPA